MFTNLSTLYTIPSATTQCVDSITISATTIGTVQYYNCSSVSVIYSAGTLGVHTITDTNCINLSNLGGTAEYTVINSGDTCQRYIYPSDIEYYQVLTAITITTNIVNGVPQYSIPNWLFQCSHFIHISSLFSAHCFCSSVGLIAIAYA